MVLGDASSPVFSRRQIVKTTFGISAHPSSFTSSPFLKSIFRPRPTKRWQFTAKGDTVAVLGLFTDTNPVSNGFLLMWDDLGTVYAINSSTGIEEWKFETATGGGVLETDRGTVYIGGGETVHAVDIENGEPLWSFRSSSSQIRSFSVLNKTAYVTTDDALYALNTETGQQRWRFGQRVPTQPAAKVDTVLVALPNEVYALSTDDGAVRWTFNDELGVHVAIAKVTSNRVYIWDNRRLSALEMKSGSEIWRFDPGTNVSRRSGTITENRAYVWVSRTLYSIRLSTGEPIWKFETQSQPTDKPSVLGERVYVETEESVHAVDISTGAEQWRFIRDKAINQFVGDVSDDSIYTTDDRERLLMLDTASGVRRWQFTADKGKIKWVKSIGDIVYAGTDAGTLYALEGPARTPIDAAVNDLRANAGAASLVTLIGGGLAVAGYRRLQGQEAGEESSEGSEDGTPNTEIEFCEPIDADGPLESYEARLPDGREVVAKRLSEEADVTRDQFLEAVETWAELDHENVRPILDWGSDTTPWVALRESTGEPIGDVEEMPIAERVETLAGACEAVHAAHRRGVTHGHLSPNDVRLPSQDCQPTDVRVGGWLARILPEEDSRSAYAAPEQADDREADPIRTDIYRLGAVAYHAVTGQPPDGGATEWTPPTDLNAKVPTEIGDVLADATAADPDERYRSALKLGDMLRWAVRQ